MNEPTNARPIASHSSAVIREGEVFALVKLIFWWRRQTPKLTNNGKNFKY